MRRVSPMDEAAASVLAGLKIFQALSYALQGAWERPTRRTVEREIYLRTAWRGSKRTKGFTGAAGCKFKGSNLAKRPARIAQKRAKASRRAATREKWLAARFGATRVETRHAINGGRA